MERDYGYVKKIQWCPNQPAMVDQYMRPVKDTTRRVCYGGIHNPRYDTQGNVHFTLPLSQYKYLEKTN